MQINIEEALVSSLVGRIVLCLGNPDPRYVAENAIAATELCNLGVALNDAGIINFDKEKFDLQVKKVELMQQNFDGVK